MKKYWLVVCYLVLSVSLFSKEYVLNEAEKRVKNSERILTDEQTGSIKYIQLKKTASVSANSGAVWLSEILNASGTDHFELYKTETDRLGYIHHRYQQMVNGVNVEDAVFYVHSKGGKVVSANGEYYSNIRIKKALNGISSTEAIQIAKKSIVNNQGEWLDELVDTPVQVIISDNEGNYNLSYKTDVYSQNPLTRKYIYVDIQTGKIIKERNRIHHGDTVGTAVTKYNGTQSITTDSYTGSFRLRQSGRGNGINTYDMNQSTSYPSAVDFVDSDNYWDVKANQDDAAYDAHFGAEATYDYYYTKYGLNSYDNTGAAINSYVHYDSNYANAFWDGSRMTYGDGDGTEYTALTSTDVVGHEITHAVTEYSAGLVYSYESGALNESFSDIFGVSVDFYKNPSTANYLIGDQFSLTGIPFRSVSNPNLYGDPDTYLGKNWNAGSSDNGGVHTNSGVQNFWFYVLANGGTGTNDNGDTYSVTGIGIDKAAAIAYRNLTTYLTPNSQYADARFYSIQSASDLYGSCSNEVIATTNAWHAVGVGAIFTNEVGADFDADFVYSCSVPVLITFNNKSTNANKYIWDFGDGSTDSTQSPSHDYTATGVYSVKLIAIGSVQCGENDTVIKSNYITITGGGGPKSAFCTPSTSDGESWDMGIYNFSFSTINNSTNGGSDGYKDYTCSHSTSVKADKSYSIGVTTGSDYNENVKVWIDYNNDGKFNNSTELVFVSNNQLKDHVGNILIENNAVQNTPLRLRVGSEYSSYDIETSCTDFYYGQYEDYSVTVLPNTEPPLVDFFANDTEVNSGQVITFTDLTQNTPTSWNWTFPGADSYKSTLKNPSVSYNAIGSYAVKLVATNAYGADSLIKVNYINVVNEYSMCGGVDTTSRDSGIVYDSGGSTGSYSSNENCSFLISPDCAVEITLSFSSFYSPTSSDYMKVYDGVDATGTLIGDYAYITTAPASIKASSGSMFITWTSNVSSNYSGWAASWNSVMPSSPPVADFSYDANPPLNTPVQFKDLTTNYPDSWDWDFGDGSLSTLQNPVHTYTTNGNYTIKLISNNCYDSDTVMYSVSVQDAAIINQYPNPIVANVSCGDTTLVSIGVCNTGLGNLVYNFEGAIGSASDSIEVLALTYGVDYASEYQNTLSAINQYFTAYKLSETATTNPIDLKKALDGKDIFLVPEQETGEASVFTEFATVLEGFVNSGGTVIFCGNGSSEVQKVFNTGLLSGTYGLSGNASTLNVIDNSHKLTEGLPSTITGQNATYTLNISNSDATRLIEYNETDVFTYRIQGKGKVIFIAYDFYAYDNDAAKIISNAVAWGGEKTHSKWLSVSQLVADTVSPSDTSLITLEFNSSNVLSGTYYDTLVVNSNDTANPSLVIPIVFNVSGQALISVSVDSINFDSVQVGTSVTYPVTISNSGCGTLYITSFELADSDFTLNYDSLKIPPFSSDSLFITFSPSSIRAYFDTIRVHNNATAAYITLQGLGIGAPTISYFPVSISDTLYACDDSLSIPIWVYNTGQGVLHSKIETNTENSAAFFDGFEDDNLNDWVVNGNSSLFEIINTNPAKGKSCLKVLGSSVSENLEYNFSSQENNISVKMRSDDLLGYSNYFYIGNTSSLYGMAYIYNSGANQYTVSGSSSYNHTVSSSSEWTQFEFKNIDYVTRKFDLYVNGKLAKSEIGFYSSTTTNVSKLTLFNYNTTSAGYYDDVQIGKKTISDWSLLSADTLITPINDSVLINATLYSKGLVAGTHNSEIILSSNDPLSPSDTIPVTFVVKGSPSIATNVFCLDYDSVMQYALAVDSLWVLNRGCDTLFVSSFLPSTSDYNVHDSTLKILPSDSVKIYIAMNDSSVGVNSDTLWISSNAGSIPVCLKAIIIAAPVISTAPSSIVDSIFSCKDSVSIPVWIYNTGQTILNSTIMANVGTSAKFYDDFEDGTYKNWTVKGTSGNFQIVNTNPASGNYCLKMIGSSSNALEYDFTSEKIDYVSVKLRSDIISGSNNYFMLGNTSYNFGVCYISHYSSNQYRVTGSTTYYHTITSSNEWTHFELKNIDYNTKKFDVYIDGVLAQSGMSFYSTTMTGLSKLRLYNGNTSYSCYYDAIQLGENLIPNWTAVSHNTINVQSNDSMLINVTLYSDALGGGIHNSEVIFNTNDPLSPTLTIPISFYVSDNPCADFSYSLPSPCSGEVNFTDNTLSNPTSWQWNFGDGDTSTVQNPLHRYLAVGNYTVKLVVCNSTSCDTTNQIVNIVDVGGPLVVNCIPKSVYNYTAYDIEKVVFNTINNTSTGTTIGYEEFTCSHSTNLIEGLTYPISITSGNSSYQKDVKIYIDYNNNALFETSELALSLDNSSSVHTGNITIPSGVTLGVGLRMRIIEDYYSYTISDACYNPYYGEVEDYTVIVESPLPVADYSIVSDSCTGEVTFSDKTTEYPTGWYWNFGDNDTSISQNPVHKYKFAGIYQVSLIVSNAKGVDTLTQTINVDKIDAGFDLLGTANVNQSIVFSDTTKNSTTWLWKFGDGTGAFIQNTQHKYTTEGIYTVELLVSNSNGCSQLVSKQLTILNNQKPEAGFLHDYFNYCNRTIQFTDTSLYSPTKWQWNFGDGKTSALQHPSHTYNAAGQYTVTLIVTNNNGTATFEDTVSLENFKADFEIVGSRSLGSQLDFNNKSEGSVISWAWDFGDGNGSSSSNPAHSYLDTGVYVVKLTVFTSNGCKDTITKTISIAGTKPPIAGFEIHYIDSCSRIIRFNETSENNPTSWHWDFGNGAISDEKNPLFRYDTAGTYSVTLLVSNSNGTDSIKEIIVVDSYMANFSVAGKFLVDQKIDFSDLSTGTIISRKWNFGDGHDTTQTNPSHTYSDTGKFSVSLIIETTNGCLDTLSQTIYIADTLLPISRFTTYIVDTCSRLVQFTNNTENQSIEWLWRFGDGDTSIAKHPTHTFKTSGVYTVTLTTTNQTGTSIVSDTIVFEELGADFSVSGDFNVGKKVNFSDNSIGFIDSWEWHFGNGSDTSIQNPSHTYSDTGVYSVNLTVTHINGCKDTHVMIISIFDSIAPVANFETQIIDTCSGAVQFTDMTQNHPTLWKWHFGDGKESTMQNPTHIYDSSGKFNVVLIVTNALGTDTFSSLISIYRIDPSFTVNGSLMVGNQLKFLNNDTTIVDWLWDFGNGFLSNIPSPLHSYSDSGQYVVSLGVSNMYSCRAEYLDTIQINLDHTLVSNTSALNTFEVYPSPNRGVFTIDVQLYSAMTIEIELINNLGQTIRNEKVENSQALKKKIEMINPEAGLYFVKLKFDTTIIMKRIVIN